MHRLESYWIKYSEQLPSDYDTLYTADKCGSCNQRHREKEIHKCPTQRIMKSNKRCQYIWQTHLICEENR